MMANNSLRIPVPSISINTDVMSGVQSQPGDAKRQQPQQSPSTLSPNDNTTPISPHSDSSRLSVQYPSSPARSLDGETLRSRSGSFQSTTFSGRDRSDSVNTAIGKSDFDIEDALIPDKGNEQDFQVEQNPFAFSPGQLNKLLNPKSLAAFKALGGLIGLERGLRTDVVAGLSVDEIGLDGQVTFEDAIAQTAKPISRPVPDQSVKATGREVEGQFGDRYRVFRDNRLPERKADSIWLLIWKTYNDKILILLTIAAVISLVLGIYEAIAGTSSVDWVEGVAICVAVIIVVTVGAANDWQKERQFIKLNQRVSSDDPQHCE